jgi:hypothetical protein
MGLHDRVLPLLAAGLAVALAACEHHTQTTSGREYLSAYAREAGATGLPMNAHIREAAAVEPLLRFPARIGLARIGKSTNSGGAALTGIPEREAAAWHKAAQSLGPKFGEFVPVSPLIAELFDDRDGERWRWSPREVVRKIQLAAARQHLDAVIIYESDGTADSSGNPLSIGEWTLIGAFILPSQDVEARGVAQAMMIDVRNGYPYGTASAEATDSSITVRFATRDAEQGLAESVRLAAVEKLAPEVEKMMRELRTELAEKRSARRERQPNDAR